MQHQIFKKADVHVQNDKKSSNYIQQFTVQCHINLKLTSPANIFS